MALTLVLEGGATRSRAGLFDGHGNLLEERHGGPVNPLEIGVDRCVLNLRKTAEPLIVPSDDPPKTLAAGISGAGVGGYTEKVAQGLSSAFGAERTLVANDLFPLLHANLGSSAGVLAISGTGSSVFAQTQTGARVRVGGRGTLFGEAGSAYGLAVRALRRAADAMDGRDDETFLIEALTHAAGLRSFDEFPAWSASAGKDDVAGLAPEVTRCAEEGDAAARECVEDEAMELARLTTAALHGIGPPQTLSLYVHGGLYSNCALFRQVYARAVIPFSGGERPMSAPFGGLASLYRLSQADPLPDEVTEISDGARPSAVPSTERPLADSTHLDSLDALGIAQAMSREEAVAAAAVYRASPEVAELIGVAASSIERGGRIIYVGAGTSGRLGVLDALECPPTFGVSPDRVVGIIAGGGAALRNSIEGAEDDAARGAKDLVSLKPPPGPRDTVIGISASGSAAYVREALVAARGAGATDALVCCNPSADDEATLVVALDTGPEVLPGSTRLKAGTATKSVLNQITTGAMALSGYVFEGRMVGVAPTNKKLRRRAERIVSELTGFDGVAAEGLLRDAGDRIAVAVVMSRRRMSAIDAARLLESNGGILRAALQSVD
ncbi:MAG TPA: N-acetylmuramic acid 6-phosphate etherase [Gammaproteobacteria bacterium]|jgi:N-acetylmuramic acid 6-phosphate etherase|nr:N-acetylmuramic acid 6-phosphate etherase [Candidatus Hydrogenedentota bacterium]HJP34353.1 N-acetylmuramic acid 6-phosphate etherase [Gammaproteobacteria bacterium]